MDTPKIIEAEKERRRKNIAEANASNSLEGFKVSDAGKALQEKYLSGEIDIKELVALTSV